MIRPMTEYERHAVRRVGSGLLYAWWSYVQLVASMTGAMVP